MISGKEREVKGYEKYIGVGEFQIIGFNLTKDEIAKKCGYEVKQEPVYTRKTADGKDAINLTIFLKEISTGKNFKTSIFMEDRERVSQDKKPQYVNEKAMSSYVVDGEKAAWFIKDKYRKAFVGEADLLNLIKNWLTNFNWFEDQDAKIDLDQTRNIITTGNVKVLNDIATRYPKQTIGLCAGIKQSNGNEYQDVYNKAVAPGWAVSKIQEFNKNVSTEIIDSQSSAIKQFLKQITGQYGYNNYYGDSFKFRVYDPKENLTNTTGIVTAGGIPEDTSY